jgi:hypothetical protein
MFISFDDGANGQPFQLNLPITPVTDIKIVDKDLLLSTMGRSFWILYDVTPLHEISGEVASAQAHLFEVKDAYRLFDFRGFRGGDPEPDEPQSPRAGANIDYYFASEPAGEVTLEILDARGNVIRAFSSEGGEELKPDGVSMAQWNLAAVGTAKLPKSAGMHRFLWDLRHPGPWDTNKARSGVFGPMVPPGTYQARLTAGGSSQTVSFEAVMDPRVVEFGVTDADVTEQVELALRARDGLSNARLAAMRVEEALEKNAGDATLTAIKKELVTAPIRYSQPMLVDQFQYLYSNLNRADQKPGQDAVDRYEELMKQLGEQVQKLERALQTTDGENP